MVEFALIAPVLVILIAGIIQFGVAINYWFELNRVANQGARWAVVNQYPGCTTGTTPCAGVPSLQVYLSCEPAAESLKPRVEISFPDGPDADDDDTGDPVKVSATTAWDIVPIIGVGRLDLTASATMRLEQDRSRYIAGPGSCP